YEPHPKLESVKPGLPAHIYAAVERALEKDRTRRYRDVAGFVGDFTGQPVPRTQPPTEDIQGEPSGVARPSMATPHSLAFGMTAPHTPAPTRPQPATPPPGAAPRPARNGRLPVAAGVALAAVAALAGAVWFEVWQGSRVVQPPRPNVELGVNAGAPAALG